MSNPKTPAPINKVRWLMLLYIAVILLGTMSFAASTEFTEKRELFRGLLRVAGFSYLVWWLPTLDKRAWWAAVVACGFFAGLGLLSVLVFMSAGMSHEAGVLVFAAIVVVPLYALTHAFVVLMQEATRQHFEA